MIRVILHSFMKRDRKRYSFFQLFSAVVFIVALAWLTVSLPFVYTAQQELAKHHKMEKATSLLTDNEEETTNPLGNNTEEKTPGNNTFSEEFIHDNHIATHFLIQVSRYHKSENSETYISFHGELLVPPPNQL